MSGDWNFPEKDHKVLPTTEVNTNRLGMVVLEILGSISVILPDLTNSKLKLDKTK